ncbi:MAG TPA: hypothetical protein GX707_09795 [Epulopiscium sp.]|nr:hypothetical protein [Candidatus Epulonipiscium sp.]
MQRVKLTISPDSIIISYFFIGLALSSFLMGLNLSLRIPVNMLRSIFVLYHGGFWVFFGWYATRFYKAN